MTFNKARVFRLSYLFVGLISLMPAISHAGLFDALFGGRRSNDVPFRARNNNRASEQGIPERQFGTSTQAMIRGGRPWIIKSNSWSEADEQRFSEFVTSISDSGCSNVQNCMTGSGNPYRSKDPAGMTWYADCGRFPYLLRAYFAFHNNLPFQSALVAQKRDANDPNAVLKYSANGNYISRRWSVTSGTNGYEFIRQTVATVYTAVFRVDSRLDVDTGMYSDLYHVKLSRKYIRPGTVVYDPNGHIATVAKVTNDGKVILLDSHPDNTVSRVVYTSAFRASSMRQAGGFKNWRPVYVSGGKTYALSNAESPGFSMEQFVGDQGGSSFSEAKWSTSDGVLSSSRYMDVVRARLSKGNVVYQPINEIKSNISNICTMMKDRIDSVNVAINKGIDKKSMPNGRLPGNIYGTDGEWEDYSTPSRDARLKTAISEFYSDVVRIYKLYQARSSKVIYDGNDLVGDMLAAYDRASENCDLSYRRSNGRSVSLSFQSFVERIYAMSFDPYHCIEQRMGASGDELDSCNQSDTKNAWYKAEQSIRNSLNRPYEKRMSWSLSELQNGAALDNGTGVSDKTPLNIRAFLKSVR